jgi:hypothetical protein
MRVGFKRIAGLQTKLRKSTVGVFSFFAGIFFEEFIVKFCGVFRIMRNEDFWPFFSFAVLRAPVKNRGRIMPLLIVVLCNDAINAFRRLSFHALFSASYCFVTEFFGKNAFKFREGEAHVRVFF